MLSSPRALELGELYPRPLLKDAVRRVLQELRHALGRDEAPTTISASPEAILQQAEGWLARAATGGLPDVVNATGVVLHSNLGRAPLAPRAIEMLRCAAEGPVALELDLEQGLRGERDAHVREALCALTGAESALVVNNNAAALLLALDTLAARREVVVSRGELIEIGGSFRLPELLAKSGAILREAGTTNRTRIEDYTAAITRRTALLLRAHPSNYRIVGFTERPSLAELATLAREQGVPLLEDLGSGALVDLTSYGLPHEPMPAESIRAGADLVAFSGDKLLGGPQAGILVGRASLIERMRRNPLKRALRVDKLTLAALTATLAVYRSARDPDELARAIPVLGLLHRTPAELEQLAHEACARLADALPEGFQVAVMESRAAVGSGAQPAVELPSFAVAVTHASWPADEVARFFRSADPAIVGRVAQGRLLLDVRAVRAAQDLVPRPRGSARA